MAEFQATRFDGVQKFKLGLTGYFFKLAPVDSSCCEEKVHNFTHLKKIDSNDYIKDHSLS